MEQNEVVNTTPVEIVGGTTVEWTLSLPHTPSAGYTGKFYLAGALSVLTKTATVDGESFKFQIAPADTSAYATGVYFYQITTEKAGEKHLEIAGEIRINALIAGAGYDGRSVAKKIVDAIDALVLNRATIDQESYQIGNRQLARVPFEHLNKVRQYYAAIVDQEHRLARIKAGKSLWPTVKIKFGNS
jgi:hypothetical protein